MSGIVGEEGEPSQWEEREGEQGGGPSLECSALSAPSPLVFFALVDVCVGGLLNAACEGGGGGRLFDVSTCLTAPRHSMREACPQTRVTFNPPHIYAPKTKTISFI